MGLHVEQGGCGVRRAVLRGIGVGVGVGQSGGGGKQGHLNCRGTAGDFGRSSTPLHRIQQVGHGLRTLQRVLRQVDAKCTFRTQHQLHPPQAVEAEVLIENAGQGNRRQARTACMKITQGGFHDGQQRRCRWHASGPFVQAWLAFAVGGLHYRPHVQVAVGGSADQAWASADSGLSVVSGTPALLIAAAPLAKTWTMPSSGSCAAPQQRSRGQSLRSAPKRNYGIRVNLDPRRGWPPG